MEVYGKRAETLLFFGQYGSVVRVYRTVRKCENINDGDARCTVQPANDPVFPAIYRMSPEFVPSHSYQRSFSPPHSACILPHNEHIVLTRNPHYPERTILSRNLFLRMTKNYVHVRVHGRGPPADFSGGHDGRLLGTAAQVRTCDGWRLRFLIFQQHVLFIMCSVWPAVGCTRLLHTYVVRGLQWVELAPRVIFVFQARCFSGGKKKRRPCTVDRARLSSDRWCLSRRHLSNDTTIGASSTVVSEKVEVEKKMRPGCYSIFWRCKTLNITRPKKK